jgi:hypothetical protein
MTKRVSLPDFGEYFRTNSRSPIDFVCRDGPNLLHDIVFLRDYIHDAGFETSKIHLGSKILRIPLQRDRWELYKTSRKLESIDATLSVSPVIALKWKSMPKRRSSKFFIKDVYLSESFWDSSDRAEIVLSSFGKNPPQLRIVVHDPFLIRLTDKPRR